MSATQINMERETMFKWKKMALEQENQVELLKSFVKHHQECIESSREREHNLEAENVELELEQVRHIEIIEEANSKLVYELEAKNGELETKLQQAQAVYNSLIDGAARDTERINDLTEKLNYVKHLHSTSWDHQQVEIKELNAKNTGLEKKLEIAVEARYRGLEQVRHIEIIEEANSKLVYELEAKLLEAERSRDFGVKFFKDKCDKLLMSGVREAELKCIAEKKLEIAVEALELIGGKMEYYCSIGDHSKQCAAQEALGKLKS